MKWYLPFRADLVFRLLIQYVHIRLLLFQTMNALTTILPPPTTPNLVPRDLEVPTGHPPVDCPAYIVAVDARQGGGAQK